MIFTCGCGDTDKFAQDAFKILFPNKEIPSIVHGISKKDPQIIREYATALVKGQEKFAYYFGWDKTDLEAWNLLKGLRIE